jgi:tetratricopeptide (TPR) repeat protein
MDKFALVYEFNKESPLITYKASKELDIKNYSKALSLLNSALDKYPYHATAYFLKSIALAYNSEYDQAREFASKGHELLQEKSTFEYYLSQIEKIKRESEGISVDFDETVTEVLNDSFLEPDDFDTVQDLEFLDEDLKNTELPGYDQSFDEKSIVTETLAEIYATQNNFEEALDIYEKLKEIKPELSDKFDNRIAELNQAIENKKQKKFGNKQ